MAYLPEAQGRINACRAVLIDGPGCRDRSAILRHIDLLPKNARWVWHDANRKDVVHSATTVARDFGREVTIHNGHDYPDDFYAVMSEAC